MSLQFNADTTFYGPFVVLLPLPLAIVYFYFYCTAKFKRASMVSFAVLLMCFYGSVAAIVNELC